MSEPFTDVAVHAHAGHLLIDLRSSGGNVRMQLTQRDLAVMLKTLIEAVSQLAAISE